MDILRIAVLGIAGVLLALLLQKEKSEYSMFISMAVCICIFILFRLPFRIRNLHNLPAKNGDRSYDTLRP